MRKFFEGLGESLVYAVVFLMILAILSGVYTYVTAF